MTTAGPPNAARRPTSVQRAGSGRQRTMGEFIDLSLHDSMAIITGGRVPGCCRIRAEEGTGRGSEDPFIGTIRGVMSKSDSKSGASRRRWGRRRVLRILAAGGVVRVADGLWWEPLDCQ